MGACSTSQAQARESASVGSSYQSSHGCRHQRSHGTPCGGRRGFHQQQDQGRSPSQERSEHSYQSGSRERNGRNCYQCGNLHQGMCPAIDQVCKNCRKAGHYVQAFRAGKPFTSAASIMVLAAKQMETEPLAEQIEIVPMANQNGDLTSGTSGSEKPLHPHQASQHRWPNKTKWHWWLNSSKWYLWLIEAEFNIRYSRISKNQSTTQKSWSSFKWRLRFTIKVTN